MKLRLHIDDDNGSRQFGGTEVKDLRDAAELLLSIAFEHDPDSRHRPGSASRIDRIDLTWEA